MPWAADWWSSLELVPCGVMHCQTASGSFDHYLSCQDPAFGFSFAPRVSIVLPVAARGFTNPVVHMVFTYGQRKLLYCWHSGLVRSLWIFKSGTLHCLGSTVAFCRWNSDWILAKGDIHFCLVSEWDTFFFALASVLKTIFPRYGQFNVLGLEDQCEKWISLSLWTTGMKCSAALFLEISTNWFWFTGAGCVNWTCLVIFFQLHETVQLTCLLWVGKKEKHKAKPSCDLFRSLVFSPVF